MPIVKKSDFRAYFAAGEKILTFFQKLFYKVIFLKEKYNFIKNFVCYAQFLNAKFGTKFLYSYIFCLSHLKTAFFCIFKLK